MLVSASSARLTVGEGRCEDRCVGFDDRGPRRGSPARAVSGAAMGHALSDVVRMRPLVAVLSLTAMFFAHA